MARHIVDAPDHRGIAKALAHLRELIANEAAFSDVRVHHSREFAEAIQLVRFDDPDEGFAEIARRRNHARPKLTPNAISTIHNAKGQFGRAACRERLCQYVKIWVAHDSFKKKK